MSEDEKSVKNDSPTPPGVEKIFISHASADAAIANEIVQEMEQRGLTCWIAPRNIRPGSDYSEEIIHGITSSNAMLVLISEKSLNSRHVRSEVARAADLEYPIYPVRLVDIEIAGGLRFFLELSQWVDLFPKTSPDIYDQLAMSIKEGRAVQQQQQNKKKHQSILLLGILGILVLFYIISDYFNAPPDIYSFNPVAYEQNMRESIEHSSKIIEETSKIYEDRLLKSMDISPYIEYYGGGIRLNSIDRIHGLPKNATVEYSFDGKTYEPFPLGQEYRWTKDIEDPYNKKLFFRAIGANGKVLKEFDKTDLLKAPISQSKQQVDNLINTVKNDIEVLRNNYCDFSKCSFRINSTFCNPMIKSMELVQGDKKLEIDRASCLDQSQDELFCKTQKDLPFALHPDTPPIIRFNLANGQTIDINQPISVTEGDMFLKKWAVFEQQNGKHNDPKLYVSFAQSHRTYGFWFALGLGHCPQGQNDYHDPRYIYADFDGQGLLEISKGISFKEGYIIGNNYNSNKNSSLHAGLSEIRVAIGPKSGPSDGPWTYKIDLGKIVGETMTQNIPEIICSDDPGAHQSIQRSDPKECMPKERADFMSVTKIEFGSTPGSYSETIDLDFTPEIYLWTDCTSLKKECPPFRFDVPKNWQNLYSRITLKDGTVYPEKRHRLNQAP